MLCLPSRDLKPAHGLLRHVTAGEVRVNDYIQSGTINPVNVVVNVASGTLKGFGMSNLRFGCGGKIFNNNFVRKTVNVTMQTTFAAGVDYLGSLITGQPFDLSSSLSQNLFVSAFGEAFAELVDAVYPIEHERWTLQIRMKH